MLQAIRNRAQGWIAWIIIILISIPFALFGIQEYLGVSSNPTVATVNNGNLFSYFNTVEITEDDLQRRVRDFRDDMRLRLGNAYRADLFEDARLRPQVLNAMIDRNVLQQAIDGWNMRTGDDQLREHIQSIPAFQRDGRFDKTLYQNALRNAGMNSSGFEATVRVEMAQDQLQQGISNSYFVTDAALAEAIRLGEQKRRIRYARIPAASFNDASSVTEEEAEAYYQRNQARYRIPEQVKLSYVRLNVDSLAHLIEVDEAKLRAYYAEYQDEFFVEEERKLRHILLATTAENASVQEQKATELLAQLRSGADFAELAKTHSEDPGSAENGGDLGWVNKGVMVEAFEQAAFALPKGGLSESVKTEFGYHIIQVEDIRGGSDVDFATMRDEVTQRYKQQQAEELYYNYFERMADAAYESPDNLSAVAELINGKVEQTGWLQRGGQLMIDGMTDPKIANAAFSEEVLQGSNSDLIEIAPIDAVVVRVSEHEPAGVKPLSDVKQQVITEAAAELAADKATEQGKENLQKLQEGSNLVELAASFAWELSEATLVSRQQADVPAEIVRAAFAVAPPETGRTRYTGVVSAEGDYVLLAVDQVNDGSLVQLEESAKQSQESILRNSLSNAEYEQLQQALRARANVNIY